MLFRRLFAGCFKNNFDKDFVTVDDSCTLHALRSDQAYGIAACPIKFPAIDIKFRNHDKKCTALGVLPTYHQTMFHGQIERNKGLAAAVAVLVECGVGSGLGFDLRRSWSGLQALWFHSHKCICPETPASAGRALRSGCESLLSDLHSLVLHDEAMLAGFEAAARCALERQYCKIRHLVRLDTGDPATQMMVTLLTHLSHEHGPSQDVPTHAVLEVGSCVLELAGGKRKPGLTILIRTPGGRAAAARCSDLALSPPPQPQPQPTQGGVRGSGAGRACDVSSDGRDAGLLQCGSAGRGSSQPCSISRDGRGSASCPDAALAGCPPAPGRQSLEETLLAARSIAAESVPAMVMAFSFDRHGGGGSIVYANQRARTYLNIPAVYTGGLPWGPAATWSPSGFGFTGFGCGDGVSGGCGGLGGCCWLPAGFDVRLLLRELLGGCGLGLEELLREAASQQGFSTTLQAPTFIDLVNLDERGAGTAATVTPGLCRTGSGSAEPLADALYRTGGGGAARPRPLMNGIAECDDEVELQGPLVREPQAGGGGEEGISDVSQKGRGLMAVARSLLSDPQGARMPSFERNAMYTSCEGQASPLGLPGDGGNGGGGRQRHAFSLATAPLVQGQSSVASSVGLGAALGLHMSSGGLALGPHSRADNFALPRRVNSGSVLGPGAFGWPRGGLHSTFGSGAGQHSCGGPMVEALRQRLGAAAAAAKEEVAEQLLLQRLMKTTVPRQARDVTLPRFPSLPMGNGKVLSPPARGVVATSVQGTDNGQGAFGREQHQRHQQQQPSPLPQEHPRLPVRPNSSGEALMLPPQPAVAAVAELGQARQQPSPSQKCASPAAGSNSLGGGGCGARIDALTFCDEDSGDGGSNGGGLAGQGLLTYRRPLRRVATAAAPELRMRVAALGREAGASLGAPLGPMSCLSSSSFSGPPGVSPLRCRDLRGAEASTAITAGVASAPAAAGDRARCAGPKQHQPPAQTLPSPGQNGRPHPGQRLIRRSASSGEQPDGSARSEGSGNMPDGGMAIREAGDGQPAGAPFHSGQGQRQESHTTRGGGGARQDDCGHDSGRAMEGMERDAIGGLAASLPCSRVGDKALAGSVPLRRVQAPLPLPASPAPRDEDGPACSTEAGTATTADCYTGASGLSYVSTCGLPSFESTQAGSASTLTPPMEPAARSLTVAGAAAGGAYCSLAVTSTRISSPELASAFVSASSSVSGIGGLTTRRPRRVIGAAARHMAPAPDSCKSSTEALGHQLYGTVVPSPLGLLGSVGGVAGKVASDDGGRCAREEAPLAHKEAGAAQPTPLLPMLLPLAPVEDFQEDDATSPRTVMASVAATPPGIGVAASYPPARVPAARAASCDSGILPLYQVPVEKPPLGSDPCSISAPRGGPQKNQITFIQSHASVSGSCPGRGGVSVGTVGGSASVRQHNTSVMAASWLGPAVSAQMDSSRQLLELGGPQPEARGAGAYSAPPERGGACRTYNVCAGGGRTPCGGGGGGHPSMLMLMMRGGSTSQHAGLGPAMIDGSIGDTTLSGVSAARNSRAGPGADVGGGDGAGEHTGTATTVVASCMSTMGCSLVTAATDGGGTSGDGSGSLSKCRERLTAATSAAQHAVFSGGGVGGAGSGIGTLLSSRHLAASTGFSCRRLNTGPAGLGGPSNCTPVSAPPSAVTAAAAPTTKRLNSVRTRILSLLEQMDRDGSGSNGGGSVGILGDAHLRSPMSPTGLACSGLGGVGSSSGGIGASTGGISGLLGYGSLVGGRRASAVFSASVPSTSLPEILNRRASMTAVEQSKMKAAPSSLRQHMLPEPGHMLPVGGGGGASMGGGPLSGGVKAEPGGGSHFVAGAMTRGAAAPARGFCGSTFASTASASASELQSGPSRSLMQTWTCSNGLAPQLPPQPRDEAGQVPQLPPPHPFPYASYSHHNHLNTGASDSSTNSTAHSMALCLRFGSCAGGGGSGIGAAGSTGFASGLSSYPHLGSLGGVRGSLAGAGTGTGHFCLAHSQHRNLGPGEGGTRALVGRKSLDAEGASSAFWASRHASIGNMVRPAWAGAGSAAGVGVGMEACAAASDRAAATGTSVIALAAQPRRGRVPASGGAASSGSVSATAEVVTVALRREPTLESSTAPSVSGTTEAAGAAALVTGPGFESAPQGAGAVPLEDGSRESQLPPGFASASASGFGFGLPPDQALAHPPCLGPSLGPCAGGAFFCAAARGAAAAPAVPAAACSAEIWEAVDGTAVARPEEHRGGQWSALRSPPPPEPGAVGPGGSCWFRAHLRAFGAGSNLHANLDAAATARTGTDRAGGLGIGGEDGGGTTLLLVMQDVTAMVVAKEKVTALLAHEHRILEALFPRHVIEFMTVVPVEMKEAGAALKCSRAGGGTTAAAGVGGSGPASTVGRSLSRPVPRTNALSPVVSAFHPPPAAVVSATSSAARRRRKKKSRARRAATTTIASGPAGGDAAFLFQHGPASGGARGRSSENLTGLGNADSGGEAADRGSAGSSSSGFSAPSSSSSGSSVPSEPRLSDPASAPNSGWRQLVVQQQLDVIKVSHLATQHKMVTILFSDCVGFTSMCKKVSPLVVMHFLNELYQKLDALLDIYKVYKVETIGDCYVVAGGLIRHDSDGYCSVLPEGETDELHCVRVMQFAKAILRASRQVALPTAPDQQVQLRLGLHCGPALSGVVGSKMPRFSVFGETVEVAHRMEAAGVPGRIHVSAAARELLRREKWESTPGVQVDRGDRMETYLWVEEQEEEDLMLQRRVLDVYL